MAGPSRDHEKPEAVGIHGLEPFGLCLRGEQAPAGGEYRCPPAQSLSVEIIAPAAHPQEGFQSVASTGFPVSPLVE